MSLSPLVSFKSRFVTYLLNFPRTNLQSVKHNMHSSYVQTATTCFNQSDTHNKIESKICSCKFCCLSYETAIDGCLISRNM